MIHRIPPFKLGIRSSNKTIHFYTSVKVIGGIKIDRLIDGLIEGGKIKYYKPEGKQRGEWRLYQQNTRNYQKRISTLMGFSRDTCIIYTMEIRSI
jgi:hypothetical protein